MLRTKLFAEMFAADAAPDGALVREMIVASGEPVYRYNFWTGEEYFLKLSMSPEHVDFARLVNGPLTVNHDRSVEATVGVIEAAWLDGGIKARARFSTAASAEDIRQKVIDGTLRNVSIEAFVSRLEKQKDKFEGLSLYVATKWEAQAVSIVPVGADRNATLMAAVDFDSEGAREMLRGLVSQALEDAEVRTRLETMQRELRVISGILSARS